MRRGASPAVVGVAALLALWVACTRELPPAPTLTGIDPAATRGASATPVTLRGQHFHPRVQADLDHPANSTLQGDFSVALTGGGLAVNLQQVTRLSDTELAAVVPASAPAGTFDVVLTDPWGRQATLEAAFEVAVECLTEGDCDDGHACTADSCADHVCRFEVMDGQCLIDGACRPAGAPQPGVACHACRPELSRQAWSPSVNGEPCSDGDACTLGERCQEGSCGGPTHAVLCPQTACAAAGTCDPASGECVREPIDAGCDDGYDCTSGDACVEGACRGTPVCGNTAPLACLTLPRIGHRAPAQVTLDPRCSHDLEDPAAGLQARFDTNGDGQFDTGWLPLAPATFTLSTPGLWVVDVEVRDTGGLTARARRHLSVAAPGEDVVVTTPVDEADDGGTPWAPGGTGLSLREAIQYVNTVDGGTIRFAAPMQLVSSALPPLTKPAARLVGEPGMSLAFDLATGGGACLTLDGTAQAVVGLTASGCAAELLLINAPRVQVVDSTFAGGASTGVVVNDSEVQLGPGVTVEGFAQVGVELKKAPTLVTGTVIRDNLASGLAVTNNPTSVNTLTRNLILRNGSGATYPAISLGRSGGTRIWHNTVHGNFNNGLDLNSGAAAVDVRNSLFTSNVGAACGVTAPAVKDPNGFFDNAGGLGGCLPPADGGSVLADAGYLAPARGDFRLRPGSAMVNRGDPAASDGGAHGTAPDLGALETPYLP